MTFKFDLQLPPYCFPELVLLSELLMVFMSPHCRNFACGLIDLGPKVISSHG